MAALLVFRFAHLSGPLDEPSWRQAWCAYQALRLAQESPMQLLHTKINMRGTNDVSFWNFPIYEGIVAAAYKLAGGGEHLWMARAVTLVFFGISALTFFLFTRRFFDDRTTWYATLVYFALPLGVFYSRAIHYDIAALAFSHLFFLFAVKFFETYRRTYYFMAVFMAIIVFAVKPPYGFYFALPAIVYAAWGQNWRRWLRDGLLGASMFVVPVTVAWLLHIHRLHIESGHSPGILYPVPYTGAYAKNWFFGSIIDRFDVARWLDLFRQVYHIVLTPWGIVFALWGAVMLSREMTSRQLAALWAMIGGVVLYILAVFPMVTRHGTHSYYLLPLLLPASWFIGRFLAYLGCIQHSSVRTALVVGIGVAALAVSSIRTLTRHGYFAYDWQRIAAGAIVRQVTDPYELIVATAIGRSTGSVDPRSLYFMGRRGWAICLGDLREKELETFRKAGANYVALLVGSGFSSEPIDYDVLSKFRVRVFALRDPQGQECGSLLLYDLKSQEGPQ